MTNVAATVKANHSNIFNYANLTKARYKNFSKINISC